MKFFIFRNNTLENIFGTDEVGILVTKIYHIYLKIHLCICGCIKYP